MNPLLIGGLAVGALFVASKLGSKKRTLKGWTFSEDCAQATVTSATAADDDMRRYVASQGWGPAKSESEIEARLRKYLTNGTRCSNVTYVKYPGFKNMTIAEWASYTWDLVQPFLSGTDASPQETVVGMALATGAVR